LSKLKKLTGKNHELRTTFAAEADVVREDGRLRVMGLACPVGVETVRWDMFRLKLMPGAFAKTLQERNVRTLWNHNDDFPLASTKSGTLKLSETSAGLMVDFEMSDVGINATFADNLARRIVEGFSIGFDIVKESWTYGQNGEMDLLEIHEVRLDEISPCTFPQYEEGTWMEVIENAKKLHARGRAGAETTPDLEPEHTAVEPQNLHSIGEQRARVAMAKVSIAKHRGNNINA
jgi:HK97 family phage prohead protease